MSATDTQQDIEANKKTVTDFLETFSKGDVDGVTAMLDDSATWWVAGTMCLSGTYPKKEFLELLGGVATGCKGPIKLTPNTLTAEGDRVAVETESYSEMNNGRVYNNLYHFVFEVRDGLIRSVKEFLDTEHTRAVFLVP